MKITEDVRKYAEENNLGADLDLEKGMEEKAREFVNSGSEIYS
jgi:phosphomethylpyrimidine synthase